MPLNRLHLVIGLCLAIVAGVIAVLLVPALSSPQFPSDWFDLTPPQGKAGITYSTKAFAESDISLPNVRAMKGSAKFVEDGSDHPTSVRLGYKLTVEIAPLDLTKVPDKYKKEKLIDLGRGRKITQLPIDQVTYEAIFEFTLKDKDGFTLLELKSDPQSVQSGITNFFQSFAPGNISAGVASRTFKIFLSMNVTRCFTCEEDQ